MTRRETLPFAKLTPATSFTSRIQGNRITLRPQGGFVLTNLRPAQLMSAERAAAAIADPEYVDTEVEKQRSRNLTVFMTKRDFVARKMTTLTSLPIGSTPNQVIVYVASPADSCRGVAHGIEPGQNYRPT